MKPITISIFTAIPLVLLLFPVLVKSANIQDVPISIESISSAEIRQVGDIENVQDLLNKLPLRPEGRLIINNGAVISLRGLGANNDPIYSAFIIDGVNVPPRVAVANIEVLRGPQGTLFGDNAGGYIKTITNFSLQNEFDAAEDGIVASVLGKILVSNEPLTTGAWLAAYNAGGYVPDLFDVTPIYTTVGGADVPDIPEDFFTSDGDTTPSVSQWGHANTETDYGSNYHSAVFDSFSGLGNRFANFRAIFPQAIWSSFSQTNPANLNSIDVIANLVNFIEESGWQGEVGLRHWGSAYGSTNITSTLGQVTSMGMGFSIPSDKLGWALQNGDACIVGFENGTGGQFAQVVGTGKVLDRDYLTYAFDYNRTSRFEGGYEDGLQTSYVYDSDNDGTLNLDGRPDRDLSLTLCLSYTGRNSYITGPSLPVGDNEYTIANAFTPIGLVTDADMHFSFGGTFPMMNDVFISHDSISFFNPTRSYFPLTAHIDPLTRSFFGVNDVTFAGFPHVETKVWGDITDSGFTAWAEFGTDVSLPGGKSAKVGFSYQLQPGHTWPFQKRVTPSLQPNFGISLNGYFGKYRWNPGDPLNIAVFAENTEEIANEAGQVDLGYTIAARVNVGGGVWSSYDLNTQHFSTEGIHPAYVGPWINFPFFNIYTVPPHKNIGIDGEIFFHIGDANKPINEYEGEYTSTIIDSVLRSSLQF